MKRLLFLLLFTTIFPATVVHAQQLEPLKLSIAPVGLAIRSGAPSAIDISLNWEANRLLEGHLELTFTNKDQVIGEYISEKLAMVNGERSYRVMLPPMKNRGILTQIEITPRFRTDDYVIEIGDPGDYQLRVPPVGKRSFLIALSAESTQALSGLGVDPFRALRLEQFDPDYSQDKDLGTSLVRIPPAEMPSSGLGYFAYDFVLLAGDGLARLNEKQLEAIAEWTAAGGSVLVVANRKLKPVHAEFLNRISGANSAVPKFVLGGDGSLLWGKKNTGSLSAPVMHRFGLGRAVVLKEPLTDEQTSEDDWHRIVGFLWKFRSNQIANIHYNKKWSFDGPQLQESPAPGSKRFRSAYPEYDYSIFKPFRPHAIIGRSQLANLLSPETIRGVPLSMVVIVLALFLLAIGPLDYYLLGFLKARKFTWILFPTLSLSFTAFMVYYAQSQMGSTDFRNALVIVDIGSEGKAVRTSRFEMIFTAAPKTVETELSNAFYAKYDPPQADDNNAVIDEKIEDTDFDGNLVHTEAPLYLNRIPTSFVVREQMQKWAPTVNRHTMLGTDVSVPNFNWNGVEPAHFNTQDGEPQSGRETLRSNILQAFPDAEIFLVNRGSTYNLTKEYETTSKNRESKFQRLMKSSKSQQEKIYGLVESLSARESKLMFKIVTQISPTGAGNFEDLSLNDESDSNQYLLIIVTKQEDDWVVYRKIYRTSDVF